MDGLMANYRFLARYNTWFNARLFDACEPLDDAARKAPRGAFFGSIHGTLNHILWGDMMWLGRFAVQPEGQGAPTAPLTMPGGRMSATVRLVVPRMYWLPKELGEKLKLA